MMEGGGLCCGVIAAVALLGSALPAGASSGDGRVRGEMQAALPAGG